MTRVGRRWRRLSLRNRLTLIAAVAVAVAVIAVSTAAWGLIKVRFYQQLDDQLRADVPIASTASSPTAALTALRPDRTPSDPPVPEDPSGVSSIVVRFLDRSGEPVAYSGTVDVLDQPTSMESAMARGIGPRFAPGPMIENRHGWRVATLPTANGAVQVARSTEGIEKTLTKLGLILILVGAGGVLGAALLGRTVARAGLRPVHALTDAVEHVAQTHDLNGRIGVNGDDEVARLAKAFNDMLAALGASKTAQRRLVEDAGHELRTPLTSLRNNIELLIHAEQQSGTGRVLPAADRARLLADLGAQAAELTVLTTELVDLARENNSPEPFEQVDLADLLVAAVERTRLRAPTVRFNTTLSSVPANARPASLERAVLNLLDNAAKWSPPDGTILVTLGVRTDDGPPHAEITVADEGPGIAPEDEPRIFERFYRATAARSMPGSGLGLAIVAQTIEVHGGSVRAERAPSGGALLRVRLPIA
ncbi:HAMP domain-containing histidine kinase [Solihabitans fulvus]|uniref:histidine kinase n=1 Tax=Solihabitans fulvus TaxID=1892852 RepID=A0A5B2WUC9_9PSEU|nr:HAMP domain-containing sensor histidine kinase [Solihabitans fulvus]KAA2254029.1 HAMP domain-containing histidine kinase [Solihabitans fulvus]